MSSCNLFVTIQNSQKEYHPGEEIFGEVFVEIDKVCRCNGLSLSLEWGTHGRGNRSSGQAEKLLLFEGEWQPGTYRYPFTLKTPVGPFTYRGHYLNVDWYLKTRADIPWAIDPKAETEFLLVPRKSMEPGEPYYFGPLYKAPEPLKEGETNPTISPSPTGDPSKPNEFSLLVKILFGIFGLLFVGFIAFAIPFFLAVLAPFFIYFYIKKVMVKSKLGEPEIEFQNRILCRGAAFEVSARLAPRKKVVFGDVYIEFSGKESVTRGSGSNKRTYTHVVHQKRYPFPLEKKQAKAGEHLLLETKIHCPADAPFTFAASSNRLFWEAKVQIELLGWPDWEKTYPITIRPGEVGHPFR